MKALLWLGLGAIAQDADHQPPKGEIAYPKLPPANISVIPHLHEEVGPYMPKGNEGDGIVRVDNEEYDSNFMPSGTPCQTAECYRELVAVAGVSKDPVRSRSLNGTHVPFSSSVVMGAGAGPNASRMFVNGSREVESYVQPVALATAQLSKADADPKHTVKAYQLWLSSYWAYQQWFWFCWAYFHFWGSWTSLLYQRRLEAAQAAQATLLQLPPQVQLTYLKDPGHAYAAVEGRYVPQGDVNSKPFYYNLEQHRVLGWNSTQWVLTADQYWDPARKTVAGKKERWGGFMFGRGGDTPAQADWGPDYRVADMEQEALDDELL